MAAEAAGHVLAGVSYIKFRALQGARMPDFVGSDFHCACTCSFGPVSSHRKEVAGFWNLKILHVLLMACRFLEALIDKMDALHGSGREVNTSHKPKCPASVPSCRPLHTKQCCRSRQSRRTAYGTSRTCKRSVSCAEVHTVRCAMKRQAGLG